MSERKSEKSQAKSSSNIGDLILANSDVLDKDFDLSQLETKVI